MFFIFTGLQAQAAEYEISAGYTVASVSSDSLANNPSGYLISAVIGGRESLMDFGVQYEEYRFSSSPDANFTKGEFQRLSLVFRKPFWFSWFYIGPAFELGVMNVETLTQASDGDSAKASAPLTWSLGLRGGVRWNSLGLGIEVLHQEGKLTQFPENQQPISSDPVWNGTVSRMFLSYWF